VATPTASVARPTTLVHADQELESARQKIQVVAQQIPSRIQHLRELMAKSGRGDEAAQQQALLGLHRVAHGIAGAAAFANLRLVAQLACALETLLSDLQSNPRKRTATSFRTVAQAIDLMDPLFDKCISAPEETLKTPLILVLDDEPLSRETTCAALEQARLRAVSIGNPELAVELLKDNCFDLIILDVQMPGLDGFQVCRRIREMPSNAHTPVVFLTSANDLDTRTRSMLSGGIDLISKPVVLIELAVKALTHLLRAHCRPAE
jgi:CheY-like chemotaxis protein